LAALAEERTQLNCRILVLRSKFAMFGIIGHEVIVRNV
jgi:hypothetical protein